MLDNLNFPWDSNVKNSESKEKHELKSFDEYFKFLEEFTPSEKELKECKIYKEPVSLF